MSVADKLRCAGGASSVKVSRDLLTGNSPVADKPVGRLLLDEIAEGIDLLRRFAGAVDLHDCFKVLQLAADLLHFLPYVRAGHGAKRDKNCCVRGLQDFCDLIRLQKRVDGIGDAGCLGAEQRHKGLRQKRKQEAYHLATPVSERVEHVGGLRHARDEIAVGNYYWRICRISIGEELDGGCIGILGGPELNGIIGALGGDAVSVRDLFEGTDVGS